MRRKPREAAEETPGQLPLFAGATQTPRYEALEKASEEIERCLKCGLCKSVCPVFAEAMDESVCARGKIAMIEALRESHLTLSVIFSDRLSRCINCKSCMEACPSGIKVDELILGARAEIFKKGRFPLVKKLIFRQLLKRGRLLPPISKTISFVERKILLGLPPSSPYRILLPLVRIDRDRHLPVLAARTLAEQYPEVLRPAGKPRMRVGFFVGCSTNLIYTDIGHAVLRTLVGEGIEVVVPRAQGCCGVPVYTAGDRGTARELAAKNVKCFKKYNLDAVVTACASCGAALKKDYDKLLGFGSNPLGVKVYDVAEFMVRHSKLRFDPKAAAPVTVTYHDPCHLNRGQGISDAPRKLLKALPQVRFVEMEQAQRCCGGGGTFAFSHYDIAKPIGRRKAGFIAASGAQVVATSCPSCIMQISDMLRGSGLPQKVVHTIELVAQCYPQLGATERCGARGERSSVGNLGVAPAKAGGEKTEAAG